MTDARSSRRPVPVRLVLFGLCAVTAVGVGFLAFSPVRARQLVEACGYYSIALTFAWAVYAVVRVAWRGGPGTPSRREWMQAGAVIVACVLVGVLTTPIRYKILFDEVVVQATASNMHLYREVSTVVRGYLVDGVFAPFDAYLDKRPFFFPFLVSLVHDVTGYREANAFALNVALMPVSLALVYWLGRKVAGHAAALAGTAALGVLTTFVYSGTSAGLEMLNLTMMLLSAALAVHFLEQPDETRLAALVLVTIVLAQTRYESVLFVVPVAAIAVEGWRRAGRILLPAAAIAAPLLLIPYAVHNTYLSGTPQLWELHEAESRFGTAHLRENITHAFAFFFSFTRYCTSSWWLSCGGFAGLAVAAGVTWRARGNWRNASAASVVLWSFVAAVVANLALLMFYYWGQLDDPAVSRLSLPFAAVLAVALAFGADRLDRAVPRASRFAAAGAVLAFFTTGAMANEQHLRLNTLAYEIEWERDYVRSLPPGERLILTNKSALPWLLQRVSSISISRARTRVDALRDALRAHLFREILVTQMYLPAADERGAYEVTPEDRLPSSFVLEPICEHRVAGRLTRISRLVDIRGEAPAAQSATGAVPAEGGRR